MHPSPLGSMSLLVLLAVCDGGHGPLAFIHVANASPLSAHRLLPQGHLGTQNDKQCQPQGHLITIKIMCSDFKALFYIHALSHSGDHIFRFLVTLRSLSSKYQTRYTHLTVSNTFRPFLNKQINEACHEVALFQLSMTLLKNCCSDSSRKEKMNVNNLKLWAWDFLGFNTNKTPKPVKHQVLDPTSGFNKQATTIS